MYLVHSSSSVFSLHPEAKANTTADGGLATPGYHGHSRGPGKVGGANDLPINYYWHAKGGESFPGKDFTHTSQPVRYFRVQNP